MAHIITLPRFKQQGSGSHLLARSTVETWLDEFERVVEGRNLDKLSTLFVKDAWIRDFLAVSWDFRTIRGRDKLRHYLESNLVHAPGGISNLRARERGAFKPCFKMPSPGLQWIESMFSFETRHGRGKGMLRLVMDPDDHDKWKCYLINLTLQELKGHEEKLGLDRPLGYVNPAGGNWQERRERQRDFAQEDPVVLVVGAGERRPSRDS